jgi:hypothetical protein
MDEELVGQMSKTERAHAESSLHQAAFYNVLNFRYSVNQCDNKGKFGLYMWLPPPLILAPTCLIGEELKN